MKNTFFIFMVLFLATYIFQEFVDAQDSKAEELISKLRDPSPEVREKAIETLGDIKDESVIESLADALKDEIRIVRLAAVKALIKIGKPAVKYVIPILAEKSWETYSAAMEVLENIGEPSVEPLIAALKDKNKNIRKNAADLLGKIKEKQAITPLIESLNDSNSAVRKSAAGALVEMGNQVVPFVVNVLKHPESVVRISAAWILGEIKDSQAGSYLIDALHDPDSKVRDQVKDSLCALGEPVIKPLISIIKTAPPDVQPIMAEILGKSGSPEVLHILIDLLNSKDINIRSASIEGLGYMKSSDVVAPLLTVLKEEPTLEKKIETTLLKIGTPVVSPLIFALEDKEWNIRSFAYQVLLKLKRAAANGLVESLGYRSRNIRGYAIEILTKIGKPAIPELILGLKHQDEFVRQGSAIALGDIGDPEVVPKLEEALRDYSQTVRSAAKAAIQKLGK